MTYHICPTHGEEVCVKIENDLDPNHYCAKGIKITGWVESLI